MRPGADPKKKTEDKKPSVDRVNFVGSGVCMSMSSKRIGDREKARYAKMSLCGSRTGGCFFVLMIHVVNNKLR